MNPTTKKTMTTIWQTISVGVYVLSFFVAVAYVAREYGTVLGIVVALVALAASIVTVLGAEARSFPRPNSTFEWKRFSPLSLFRRLHLGDRFFIVLGVMIVMSVIGFYEDVFFSEYISFFQYINKIKDFVRFYYNSKIEWNLY